MTLLPHPITGSIRYVLGDATAPAERPALIVHICNDIGGWGSGFVLAISRRWPAPEAQYRAWKKDKAPATPLELGRVQFVEVEPDLFVANLIGQRSVNRRQQPTNTPAPIRYEAVEMGLAEVARFARTYGLSVHMPRIGCGLAGGRWELVEPLIQKTLIDSHIPVTVYDWTIETHKNTPMQPIEFYSTNDEYGCFSNFSAHPITIAGQTYPTTEHFFQSQKFAGTDDAHSEAIRLAKSPMIAARLGRSRKHKIRPDWESAKDAVMHAAVLAKFTAHSDIRQTLLSTGQAKIIEATAEDYYWGAGTTRTGKNRLGQILQEVRTELSTQPTSTPK